MIARHHFTKVRWKNLFSYGNTWTEIQLDRSPSTIITGKNGAGKSVVGEAITFAVTGQSIRKLTKAKLVNNKSKKEATVELYWMQDDKEHMIRRSIKPDSLEVWIDGLMQNQEASVKQTQEYIYKDLLKTDRTSWQITHMISKSGIQMFMSLKTEERRQFIDNMLGTQVFTVMAKAHKAEVDQVTKENTALIAEVSKADAQVDAKDSEIATYIGTFEEYNRSARAAHDAVLELLEARVKEAADALQNAENADDGTKALEDRKKRAVEAVKALQEKGPDYGDLEKRVKDLEFKADMLRADADPLETAEADRREWEKTIDRREALRDTLGEVKGDIRNATNQLSKLKAGVCDVCGMEASEDHVHGESERINDELDELEKVRDDLEGAIQKNSEKCDALETKRKESEKKIAEAEKLEREAKDLRKDIDRVQSDHERSVKRAEDDIIVIEDQIEQAADRKVVECQRLGKLHNNAISKLEEAQDAPVDQKNPDTDRKLEQLRGELEALEDKFEEVCEKRDIMSLKLEYLNVITAMLKEGGVKTTIVRKFMPQVNRIVNESMHRLGMNAKFTMDENFDEVIIWNGQEYEFNQLSEGERLRVNISLLMAWREIARMQSRLSSNFLFFDEVMGESLDEDGYAAMEDIFERSFGGLNVFMITHSPEKVSSFMRSAITFEKHAGFSRIAPSE